MGDVKKKILIILSVCVLGVFAILFWEKFLGFMMIFGFICFLVGWLSIFKK